MIHRCLPGFTPLPASGGKPDCWPACEGCRRARAGSTRRSPLQPAQAESPGTLSDLHLPEGGVNDDLSDDASPAPHMSTAVGLHQVQ